MIKDNNNNNNNTSSDQCACALQSSVAWVMTTGIFFDS